MTISDYVGNQLTPSLKSSSPSPKRGHVYLYRASVADEVHYKIGYSLYVDERVNALKDHYQNWRAKLGEQPVLPTSIQATIRFVIPGTRADEHAVHCLFDCFRVEGSAIKCLRGDKRFRSEYFHGHEIIDAFFQTAALLRANDSDAPLPITQFEEQLTLNKPPLSFPVAANVLQSNTASNSDLCDVSFTDLQQEILNMFDNTKRKKHFKQPKKYQSNELSTFKATDRELVLRAVNEAAKSGTKFQSFLVTAVLARSRSIIATRTPAAKRFGGQGVLGSADDHIRDAIKTIQELKLPITTSAILIYGGSKNYHTNKRYLEDHGYVKRRVGTRQAWVLESENNQKLLNTPSLSLEMM